MNKSKKLGRPPKKKAGRPIGSYKIDAEIVKKITDIFKVDGTEEEACGVAGISVKTHHNRINENVYFLQEIIVNGKDGEPVRKFKDRLYKEAIEEAKQYPFIMARKTLFKSITSGNDRKALDFLERRDNRYKPKTENKFEGNPFEGVSITVKKKK